MRKTLIDNEEEGYFGMMVTNLPPYLFSKASMSRVRQVGLLAAGCQPWNKDVCAASGDRFAYCATLAIYVYQVSNPTSSRLFLPSGAMTI